jgi:hypothetical protein
MYNLSNDSVNSCLNTQKRNLLYVSWLNIYHSINPISFVLSIIRKVKVVVCKAIIIFIIMVFHLLSLT